MNDYGSDDDEDNDDNDNDDDVDGDDDDNDDDDNGAGASSRKQTYNSQGAEINKIRLSDQTALPSQRHRNKQSSAQKTVKITQILENERSQ